MEWLFYILKVSACLALFYGFYHFFLQKLTFFRENRCYLLLALLMSFLIPLLSIEMERQVQPLSLPGDQSVVALVGEYDPSGDGSAEHLNPLPSTAGHGYNWSKMILVTYWLSCVVLALKLLANVFAVLKAAKEYRKVGRLKVIYKKEGYTNCSFFNYVFVDRESLSGMEIEILLQHEKIHALSWHSLDKILMTACKIFLWFNPLIYLYDKALEQVHEYEADRETSIRTGGHSYANLLLKMAIDKNTTHLLHYLVKSPVKDRIKMLFTKPSNHMKKFIYVAVLPLMALLMSSFSLKYMDKVVGLEKLSEASVKAFQDSIRYKQKIQQQPGEKREAAKILKWRSGRLYKENLVLSRQISGKALRGVVKEESTLFQKRGFLFESGKRTYLLDVAGLTENRLRKGDAILVEVDVAGVSNKSDYVVLSPGKITRNGETVFLKKKTLPAPFLYEANKVRFTDGVITAVNQKVGGDKELAIEANGYTFKLELRADQVLKESRVSLVKGDQIRLRFVHELKTGDKSYFIKDWVAISKDIKSYGMMNRNLFDRFYEKLHERRAATGKLIQKEVLTLPDFQDKGIRYSAHDSTKYSQDKNTIYLYEQASAQSGDVLVSASEIVINAKTKTGWAKNALVRKSGETTEKFYPSAELKFSDGFHKGAQKKLEP
ncbi:M56 family metallopeptidase [Pedobacter nutrimenti]|uniref:BlaR1 peptidase M56 n=1 Tax=Pedobacter nutrimenti TaxID=1241337 RepID=A0A318UL12_9SPHI|nr:M56 family metallopeptidase [Pedobacter nutrimenti]PYF76067.1 BlaR1 peptidase M56 [Pedobacter nutrimenti]